MHGTKFPEFSHMSESRFKKYKDPCLRVSEVTVRDQRNEGLIDVIFAPDPVTGIPCSDIGYIMSQDSNPQVAQFVRDNLLRLVPEGVRFNSADTALDLTPEAGESIGAFADRLKQSIQDLVKSSTKQKS